MPIFHVWWRLIGGNAIAGRCINGVPLNAPFYVGQHQDGQPEEAKRYVAFL